jgi:hypothetical protein
VSIKAYLLGSPYTANNIVLLRSSKRTGSSLHFKQQISQFGRILYTEGCEGRVGSSHYISNVCLMSDSVGFQEVRAALPW